MFEKPKGKKGSWDNLIGGAKSIVLLAVIVCMGIIIFATMQSNSALRSYSAANTSIGIFSTGLGSYGNWVTILVLVSVIAFMFVMLSKVRK